MCLYFQFRLDGQYKYIHEIISICIYVCICVYMCVMYVTISGPTEEIQMRMSEHKVQNTKLHNLVFS
jgi:hypothetical protein